MNREPFRRKENQKLMNGTEGDDDEREDDDEDDEKERENCAKVSSG